MIVIGSRRSLPSLGAGEGLATQVSREALGPLFQQLSDKLDQASWLMQIATVAAVLAAVVTIAKR